MRREARLAAVLASAYVAAALAQSNTTRVFVFATNSTGAVVEDLAAAEFDVKEAGKTCRITSVRHGTDPMRVVLLVDAADETRLPALKRGMAELAAGLPADAETGLATVSTGYVQRIAPTLDRARLSGAIGGLRDDHGGSHVVRALLDAEAKLFREQPARWPVYVVVAADATGEDTSAVKQFEFDAFSDRLVTGAATVHAILINQGENSQAAKIIDALTRNLTQNTGGLYQELKDEKGLTEALAAVGARISEDARRMAAGYELTFVGAPPNGDVSLEIGTNRPDVTLRPSLRRVP